MPLPLPNLDTRRWADLVEEGRSLIPRYAPGWTDHNIHDPGITLMELFAWITDLAIYRTNAISVRHRRKFLALIGFPPQPPHPAQTAFAFSLSTSSAEQVLPAGITIATPLLGIPGDKLRFRTTADLAILPCTLTVIQGFDGAHLTDHTRAYGDGISFYPWGSNPLPPDARKPEEQPAFYLGFQNALPMGKSLSLWLQFTGRGTDWQERDRILTELQQTQAACQALHRANFCPPGTPDPDTWCTSDASPAESPATQPSGTAERPLQHHTVQTIWEYYTGSQWQVLDPDRGEIVDQTRGFSLSGAVQVTLPGSMGAISVGLSSAFYLRCRLVKGLPDAAPQLATVGVNAVAARQSSPVYSTFAFSPTTTVSGTPTVRQINKLSLVLDDAGLITELTVNPPGEALEAWVLDYRTDSRGQPISLTLTLIAFDRGSGFPQQTIQLDSAITITDHQIQLWTVSQDGVQRWQQQPDLDASRRTDAHFQWDPTRRILTFGDGEQGRVVPEGAWIVAAYDTTAGATGNLLKSLPWQLLGADDPLNQAVLGMSQADLKALAQRLAITPCALFTGGTDPEELDHAAGRAVETLWAHERLIDLCPPSHSPTLDQIDRARVLSNQAPERAVTLLDFERLALEVPGTRVARARAWAGLDPAYPCALAPGTVTVVVVPELPQPLPCPSRGLLATVQRYLDRRRSIGTRLVVVAPEYLEVQVQATVLTQRNADPNRVSADILTALNRFLDPLQGGINGFGYPFGRDVYRTEILQVIDEVAGVDHVGELRLIGRPLNCEINSKAATLSDGERGVTGCSCADDRTSTPSDSAQCGNLCVAPIQVVAPGQHNIQVLRGGPS